MKWAQGILILSTIYCNTLLVSAQNITVDDTKTAQYLVENVLVNSSCATVSNAIATGDSVVPVGLNSYGFFTNAGGAFPFKEGVLLSTQYAQKSIGPYAFVVGNDNDTAWLGDPDLNQALGISTSINATLLEFDFIPLTNFLSFDYIFASIEYNGNGSCRFTDAFAFLIRENTPGAAYQNLAVLPGTSTPVSSTNIHPTIPTVGNNVGCAAVNQQYFNGFNDTTSPINYTGQTAVMNSQSKVIAGKSYHIKLVIANDKNEFYDSAVFLNAGSFAPKIDLGTDRTMTTNNPVCFGEIFTIDTKLPINYNYKWFKDNIEIVGETKPTLDVTATGNYKVEIVFTPATCVATDAIRIEYASEIVLSNATLAQCDENNDGITIFNLSKMDTIIKNNSASLSPVVYYESLTDAQGKLNPILNPVAYTNKPAIPVLYARVTNSFGCANFAKVDLVLANNTIPSQSPIATCDADAIQDGLYQFNLNAEVNPQILSGLPAGMMVEYYANTTDAVLQKNALPNIFTNTTPNQQNIQARIVNGPDCFGIIPISLAVNTFSPSGFQDETASLCSGLSTDLSVATGFSSYLWNTGETTAFISVSSPGNYSVTVTDVNGCKALKKFTVTSSEMATITDAIVNDFSGNENTVELKFSGIGNYEFSLDGLIFQDSPIFQGIAPGKYLAVVNDKNGCGLSASLEVFVLDYPRFFTPNGDGFNDVWKIKNLNLFPAATLVIYNRYGQLLFEINTINTSWNGKINGAALPSDDYWFQLNFGNGEKIKGHFSLKR
jgi:gliding motility-associated-like protein